MTEPVHGSTWATYRRLFSLARPYWGRLTLAVLAGVVGSTSLIGLLQLSQNIFLPFDQAGGKAGEKLATLPGLGNLAERLDVPVMTPDGRMTWQFLVAGLVAIPILVLVREAAAYFNRYYMRWVGARLVRDLRDRLFDRMLSQSLAFFGRSDVGNLISRGTNDAAVVEGVVASTAEDLVKSPLEIAAGLTFAVYFSMKQDMLGLVAVMLVVFPAMIVPVIVLGRVVRRYTRRALGRISDVVSRMHETFTGVKVVKAYGMEQAEAARFRTMNAQYFRTLVRALRAELLMQPMMEFVTVLTTCGFFVVCFAKGIGMYQIFPLALAGVAAYKPIKNLARVNSNLQRGNAALDRIFALLDTDTALREAPDAVELADFTDRIAFEDVTFEYEPGGTPVLKDVAFEIPRGAVVAVVGETGSGKSTVANLLARFYDPTAGRVRIDGTDLRSVRIASLRRLIGVVTQETILFNDTVAANIAYGLPDADPRAIEEAARQANAHDFIVADPSGYQRVVGEKGFLLSGGERQRIALARAILKNPPILILDEATSALDTVTEHLVQEAIARVMKHRTVFAIAHRLSTVRHANLILVLESGRIVERGTHAELYAAGGRYRKLCDMQSPGGALAG